MNELTLDGKTYVSSKRAAEMTGYAKDYVGQMCREGRVEARLVGRNWYVLKSGIEKHRFNHENEEYTRVNSDLPAISVSEWATPHYEIASGSDFPMINRLNDSIPEPKEAIFEPAGAFMGTIDAMQESWRAWFTSELPDTREESQNYPVEEDTIVPIHSIDNDTTQQEPVNLRLIREYRLDDRDQLPSKKEERVADVRPRSGGHLALRISLVILGLIAVGVGYIGTGFIASNAVSASPFSMISGVSVYNKAK
jgi:hypothetical protein